MTVDPLALDPVLNLAEGEERRLLTITEAAAELGVTRQSLCQLIRSGKLLVAVPGKKGRHQPTLLSEVALRRYRLLEEHHRILESRAKNNAERVYEPITSATGETLPSKAAALYLGVNLCTLTIYAQRNELITYRAPGNRQSCFYAIDELRSLATRLAFRREAPRKIVKPVKRHRKKNRCDPDITVEACDLQIWERSLKNFRPYYSPRQAAYVLNISVKSLNRLRRRGRLKGYFMDNLRGFGRPMNYYLRSDVWELLDDERYVFRRDHCLPALYASLRTVGLDEDEEMPRRLGK